MLALIKNRVYELKQLAFNQEIHPSLSIKLNLEEATLRIKAIRAWWVPDKTKVQQWAEEAKTLKKALIEMTTRVSFSMSIQKLVHIKNLMVK